MRRSALGARMSVAALARSLVGLVSVATAVETFAVLVTVVPDGVASLTRAVRVRVALAPLASEETVQVIEPPENALQVMPLERTKVVPAAMVSETVTVPVTLLGPRLVAVMVMVNASPCVAAVCGHV